MGNELPPIVSVTLLMMSFLLAVLSWKFIETPFRRNWKGIRSIKIIGAAAICTALIAGTGFALHLTNGLLQRLPQQLREAAKPMDDKRFLFVTLDQIREGNVPTLGIEKPEGQASDFIVWGDSHALSLYTSFDQSAKDMGLSGVIAARSGTPPLVGVTRPFDLVKHGSIPSHNQAVLDYIRKHEIANVVLVARWAVTIEGRKDGSKRSLIAEQHATETDKPSARAAMVAGLGRTLDALEKLGANVWILKQVPLQNIEPQRLIVRSLYFETEIPKGVTIKEHEERQSNANMIIDEKAKGRDGVTTIDLSSAFFPTDDHSLIGGQQGSYYRDDNHVSILGADEILRPVIDSVLIEMGRNK